LEVKWWQCREEVRFGYDGEFELVDLRMREAQNGDCKLERNGVGGGGGKGWVCEMVRLNWWWL
jgi:hypothetical protein